MVLPTVLVSGYALTPKGTTLHEQLKTFGVVLEIDTESDTIVDAAFMLLSDLGRDFCRRLVVGYNLNEGVDPLLARVSDALLLPSQPAITMALRAAVQRYQERTSRKRRPEISLV